MNRYNRQSFLGWDAQERTEATRIGIVGLGGGGSHVVQQAAHIGFQHPTAFDADTVDKEGTNLNRLVGATLADAKVERPKVEVAHRLYSGLQPDASVRFIPTRWQNNAELLRSCHIVIGCVDSYSARSELESFCRRFLMAYIDIGMDIHGDNPPVIGGQVILSLPGGPCLRCMGFITEERLSQEGARYGNAGGRPQVIWPNGVLASTAVGLAMELITDWTKRRDRKFDYIVYDGNRMTLQPHLRHAEYAAMNCEHYPIHLLGKPRETRL